MTDLNAALLEQLVRQNDLLATLVEQGNERNLAARTSLWHTRNSTKNETAIRANALRPLLSEISEFTEANQLGLLETVQLVGDNKLSFARFGDGELQLMLRKDYSLQFQRNSPRLATDLLSAYTANEDDLLIGFPNPSRDVHWSGVWADIWDDLKVISPVRKYGNAQVTRPSFFRFTGEEGVKAWRNVWEGRKAVIITGEGSRFELIPELFDNLGTHQFVYSKPTNAYADLPRVLESLAGTGADIALISLGPTGTILAAELAARGMQAIDLGHISDSYLHTFKGGAWPEAKPASKQPTRGN